MALLSVWNGPTPGSGLAANYADAITFYPLPLDAHCQPQQNNSSSTTITIRNTPITMSGQRGRRPCVSHAGNVAGFMPDYAAAHGITG